MTFLIVLLVAVAVSLYIVHRKNRAIHEMEPVIDEIDEFCGRDDVDDALKILAYDLVRDATQWKIPVVATFNMVMTYGHNRKGLLEDMGLDPDSGQFEDLNEILKKAMFVNFKMSPITWVLCTLVIMIVAAIRSDRKPSDGGGFDDIGRSLEGSWFKAVH